MLYLKWPAKRHLVLERHFMGSVQCPKLLLARAEPGEDGVVSWVAVSELVAPQVLPQGTDECLQLQDFVLLVHKAALECQIFAACRRRGQNRGRGGMLCRLPKGFQLVVLLGNDGLKLCGRISPALDSRPLWIRIILAFSIVIVSS